MICELRNNNNTPLCFIGIQGSPNCSINWGKHKVNKYKTESIIEDEKNKIEVGLYGVMTMVLDEMLKANNIDIPYFEAPVKESIDSDLTKKFFNNLDELLNIPQKCRYKFKISQFDKNEINKE